jgi:hypothetical protein
VGVLGKNYDTPLKRKNQTSSIDAFSENGVIIEAWRDFLNIQEPELKKTCSIRQRFQHIWLRFWLHKNESTEDDNNLFQKIFLTTFL